MASSYPIREDALALLWQGEDPVLHTALLERLEAAGIPFADRALGDEDTVPVDPLPIDWRARFGFEVSVASSQLSAAREILEKLLDRDPVNVELPAQDSEVPATVAGPEAVSETQKSATQQIWSSSDIRATKFLLDALRENSIPTQVQTTPAGTIVFVPPSLERRAAEIVREVTESSPPE